jgi:hypothetical protein
MATKEELIKYFGEWNKISFFSYCKR